MYDWEHRGKIDYPRCDLYPHRDRFSEQNEKDYLVGWWKSYNETQRSLMLERMAKGI